jgi:GR25 family glycosyltransferase involved in LPS biosynthesis
MPKRKSRKRSKFNSYFNHIFVINLFDRPDRWKKVDKQFTNRGINPERFIAIDGRCKKTTKESCEAKRKTFEMIYNVGIPNKHNEKVQDILPRSSITIGTLLILREMVKRRWKRILICEDDIILERDIEKKFVQGIKEIGNKRWDLLYLGCGGLCGSKDISNNRTKRDKHITTWKDYYGDEFYTKHHNDLRYPCDKDTCVPLTEHITTAFTPGGGWCYAYSLSGAKKVIKAIGNDASRHIDQLIPEQTKKGKINALAFDPPIVWHENMRMGKYDSDNPWL